MGKGGRPRIEIDQDQFKKLCGLQCTLAEIAGFFDCSEDTIENWCKRELNRGFSDAFKEFSASGKISLRRNQFRLAEKSAAMAIFLGKQYLGQKDSIEYEDKESIARLDAILNGMKNNAVTAKSEAE